MNFSFISGEAVRASGELLVIPLFEGELGDKSPAPLAGADKALGGKLATAATQEGFKGKGEQSFVMHTLGRLEAERLLLLGLGSRARYSPEALRQALTLVQAGILQTRRLADLGDAIAARTLLDIARMSQRQGSPERRR